MITKVTGLKALIIMILAFSCSAFSFSQEVAKQTDLVTISGIIKDRHSRNAIESANILIKDAKLGTVSNADGRFALKIFKPGTEIKLEISHMGYRNKEIIVPESAYGSEQTVYIEQINRQLDEIVVVHEDAIKLIEQAIDRIEQNYSENETRMTGFYRETVQKGRRYVNIAEGVIDIYKTSYHKDVNNDNVQLLKGRSLLSPRKNDTLAVKLLGGVTLCVYADFVKNRDMFFSREMRNLYSFRNEKMALIDNNIHYVVSFKPKYVLPVALYSGNLYIDKETLAFSRAEFSLDMSNIDKATAAILYKKPLGLRFKPEELSTVIAFKKVNEKYCLSYTRNEIRFKCDWKRRLFATNYTVISETVTTDFSENDVDPIRNRQAFKYNHSLSDKVSDFYDVDFWKEYNIIEPTESLENAVNKLKKYHRNLE